MEKAEIIETPEKVENVVFIPRVVNEADDPSVLSKTTITVLPESVDKVAEAEEEKEVTVTSETEKKGEKKETSKETLPEKKIEEKPPKEKDAVQKRIDELTKKWRTTERERDFKDKKILELEEELKKTKDAIPQGEKPKLENFETEADYLEAITDWKIEQKMKLKSDEVSREKASAEEKTVIDETYQELDDKMEKGRTKYADFDEFVLDEDLKFSETMVEAILFSDTAEDVLYYLGKHPEESANIAKLSPLKVAHELGKIEAKLNAPPLKKKTTNAPEPITPVRTTGITEKDPSGMTPREYRAWREKSK